MLDEKLKMIQFQFVGIYQSLGFGHKVELVIYP
jgi:hypothetical protein